MLVTYAHGGNDLVWISGPDKHEPLRQLGLDVAT
jgi:hypothetical protein